MSVQRSLSVPVVVPAQVWVGLATEAQAGAIQLMARLASNVVIQGSDSPYTELAPCLHDSLPRRSDPSISTAKP
jgi:hypothetical protein